MPIAVPPSSPSSPSSSAGSTDASLLPVTLLSGFLGAGKTTLLEYILKSKDHGLRCAIIVNDIGALNIDGALITNHNVKQKEETLIQMQNGCICCTLRGDLLEEIADLAEKKEFDYLIIESTGVSEPMQVAETFSAEFSEQMAAEDIEASLPTDATPESKIKLAKILASGGLSKISRLDTCVTVVDCTTFMGDFDTTDFLSDRNKDVGAEDERNITDLLVDQIEFATVILINKTDVVGKEDVARVHGIVSKLNPTAKIIETVRSRVDLKEILNTGKFSFEEAATGAGWLQSLKESNRVPWTGPDGVVKMVPKPETEEYGIGSFVYRARRPFHPERLWHLVSEPFVVIQNEFVEDDEDEESGSDASGSEDEDADMDEDGQPQLDLPGRLAFKRASPLFKSLLRSKGFVWLATRPKVSGEWSQSGVMFTLQGGTRWLCCEDESSWPMSDNPEVVRLIKADFEGAWGDRRQEIVFIGEKMDRELLTKTLDSCLLNDGEFRQWEQVMKSKRSYAKQVERLVELFTDGWEDWQDPGLEEEEAIEAAKEEEEKRKLKEKRKATLELMKKHEGHKHSKGKGKRV